MTRSPLGNTASRVTWLEHRFGAVIKRAAWVAVSMLGLLSAAAQATLPCEEWHAELLVVEGNVEVQRGKASGWARAVEGDVLCMGDTIRVNGYGRAAVVLPDESLLRLDWSAELTFEQTTRKVGALVRLLRGIIHVVSRDPRSLSFSTPYANAGLEGTEFDIGVAADAPQAEITVLEGEVVVTNATARVSVPAGAAAAARAEGAPLVTPVAVPVDRMRWASYYRPLLASELPAPDAAASAADAADPDFYAARAAARLRYGRVDEALSDLAEAERLEPGNATAPALRSLIATTHGDKSTALTLAERARSLDTESPIPLLALSYAQQALADVAAARETAERAVELAPRNALAWTRRAELALASGDVATSIESATRATVLDPALSAPHTVLGFVHLRSFDVPSAIRAFERSTTLDRSVPLGTSVSGSR